MGYLLARHTKSGEFFRVMYSEDRMYNIPTDYKENSIEFTPDPANVDDEWLRIERFSKTGYILEIMKRPISSTEFNSLKYIDNKNISLLLENDSNLFLFQRITPAKIIRNKKSFLSKNIDNEFEIKEISDSIELTLYPVAIYDATTDILYFRRFGQITAIFPNIEELYREATNQEVKSFLENNFIQTTNFNFKDVKTANRKRIAIVQSVVNSWSDDDKKNIIKYICNYTDELTFENGKFCINNDKELRTLLWGLEERFFEKPLTKEKCVARKVTAL